MIFNYLRPISFKRSSYIPMGLVFILLNCLLALPLAAQVHHCHADELLSEHITATESQNELRAYRESISHIASTRGAGEVINISVVFHIIHHGESVGNGPNLSDSRILEQLSILNTDFSLQNSDKDLIPNQFTGLAADTEIQFCLASVNPNGQASSGIIRHQMPAISSINNIENTVKPQTQWDADRYLNIWIVKMPEPTILGYAYLPIPSILGTAKDGVVISHLKVGNVGQSTKGRTLVHEVGHYLGLPHIWGFDEGDCTEDDQISDTPPTFAPYYGCPQYPQFTCGSSDMFMNFMDYVDDNCMYMFTSGQKSIMRNILANQRSSLASASNTVCSDLVSTFSTPSKEDQLILYPNPCQDLLGVSVPKGLDLTLYSIYNSAGKLIKTENLDTSNQMDDIEIATQTLENGIYVVRFETKSGDSIVKRFVCSQQ